MTNAEALKKLAAALIGGDITPDDIPENVTSNLISFIADVVAGNYIANLAVVSAEGDTAGNTAITVSPALAEGNSYQYQLSDTEISAPEAGSVLSYTAWNGEDEIPATSGQYIGIYEVDSGNKVKKFGQTVIEAAEAPIDSLTVTSAVGSDIGYTTITVSPELTEGNSYRYTMAPSISELPERNADLSSWTEWDGTSEIEAEDGHKICICEVDSNNLAIKGGIATIASV